MDYHRIIVLYGYGDCYIVDTAAGTVETRYRRVTADWERFRGEWQNYEIAVDLDSASDKKRAAVFLACIGSAAQSVFRTFQFTDAEHHTDVTKIMEAFDRYCIGETNVTYERYVFNERTAAWRIHRRLRGGLAKAGKELSVRTARGCAYSGPHHRRYSRRADASSPASTEEVDVG